MFIVIESEYHTAHADAPAKVVVDDFGAVVLTVGEIKIIMAEYDARTLELMLGMAYGLEKL